MCFIENSEVTFDWRWFAGNSTICYDNRPAFVIVASDDTSWVREHAHVEITFVVYERTQIHVL